MSGSEDGLILSQSEYEHLLEEIHKLQARITELTALRDDLVYHVCPALRAEYDEKIVSLERELMAANMYLRELQRTIEILQAQMNMQQELSMEEAQAQAKAENREYEEELHRKAEEAKAFKKKWEESQWSKHEREEREAKEKEREDGEDPNDEKAGGPNGADGETEGREDGRKDAGQEDRDSEDKGGDGDAGADRKKDGDGGNDGDSGQDGSRQGADDDSSNDPGEGGRKKSPKEETIAQKIKRLYRKIVKRLHPDVHPNPTEHEKDLLNRAMKAFQEGDLSQLEKIWDELSGMDAPEDVFEDTPEGRGKLRELLEKLKVRLRLLELEIDHIKSDFPYKLKSFLENPVAVEETRRGIMSKIDNVREMNRQLEKFIEELKEKMRKGEKP